MWEGKMMIEMFITLVAHTYYFSQISKEQIFLNKKKLVRNFHENTGDQSILVFNVNNFDI